MAEQTYDIFLLNNTRGLNVPLDSGGMVCTGVVKLSQRFVIAFLSPIGEDIFEQDKGTRISSLRIASLSATSSINNAIYSCVEYIQRTTPENAPPEETLVAAALDTIIAQGDTIYVRIVLTTASGIIRKLDIPTGLAIT